MGVGCRFTVDSHYARNPCREAVDGRIDDAELDRRVQGDGLHLGIDTCSGQCGVQPGRELCKRGIRGMVRERDEGRRAVEREAKCDGSSGIPFSGGWECVDHLNEGRCKRSCTRKRDTRNAGSCDSK